MGGSLGSGVVTGVVRKWGKEEHACPDTPHMGLWIVVAETSIAPDCPGLPVEKEEGEPAPQEVP